MRRIIASLILVNALVFGWLYTHQDQYGPAPTGAAQSFPPNVEPLRLLRERDDRAVIKDLPGAPLAVREPAPAVPSDDAVAEYEAPPEEVAAVAGHEVTTGADTETETEAEPGTEAASAAFGSDNEVVVAVPADPICYSVGPFLDRRRVDAFAGALARAGRPPVVRTAKMEQPSGYWVFVAAGTRSAAQAIVSDLAAKRVVDYFLGRDNVISLGIYSDKRTAERRVREISGLGYEPRLEARFVSRTVYWLDLDDAARESVSEDRWHALMNAHEGVTSQETACE